MDREHLSQALLATTVANDQKQAGQFLDQVGFLLYVTGVSVGF